MKAHHESCDLLWVKEIDLHANLASVIISPMSDVTEILNQIEHGDRRAAEELLPMVYDELRVLARQRLANEKPGQTLQPTDLVHEAFLRLVGQENKAGWDNRGHFFAAAAEAMRRILVDNARRKMRPKHGGGMQRVDPDSIFPLLSAKPESILAFEDVLSDFERREPEKAKLIKLRYFTGLSLTEAADAMKISASTAKRYWSFARASLFSQLTEKN